MRPPTCAMAGCDHPVHSIPVCQSCLDHFADQLARVGEIADELTTTLIRQSATTAKPEVRASGKADSSRLPYDVHASTALTDLRVDLARAASYVQVLGNEIAPQADHPQVVANYIALRRAKLAGYRHGPEHIDRLLADIAHALDVIDRGPDQRYLGPCVECGRSLYVEDQAATASCPCGHAEPANTARLRATQAAGAQLVTAKEAASILPTLTGRPVPLGTVKAWFSRREVPIRVRDGVAVALVSDLATKLLTGKARKAGTP